jgi:YVTN family beta-propeller protein
MFCEETSCIQAKAGTQVGVLKIFRVQAFLYSGAEMKKAVGFALFLLWCSSGWAQNTPALYKQTAKWVIGGEGGWDYLTVDTTGNRLFVGHSSKFEVIDLASGKKVGEIPAIGAHGVAVVADQNLGFSSNGRAGTVTVFDLKTLKPQSEIKVGENPDAIIYDPHSKHVLVMNGRSKEFMAIDPATQKVVATIPLGGKLEFVTTDEGHAYVNVEDTGEIATVDTKTWKAGPRWKLQGCEEPAGMAIDEKTGRVFSVCGNKVMVVVDTKSGKQIATIPTGAGTDDAGFDPGLKYAFASNGEGTLTVVRETKDGKCELAGNVATARGARTLAVDAKTHNVYLATAEFGPPVEGQRRPPIKPDTFMILVYSPVK